MEKYNNYQYYILAVVLIYIIILPTELISQKKYTVLLPEIDIAIKKEDENLHISANSIGIETAKSFFKFNFDYLPQNAKVEFLNLKLYNLPNKMSGSSSQIITVLKGTNSWTGNETTLDTNALSWADIANNPKSIGRAEVTRSSTAINMKLIIPGSPQYVSSFIPDGVLSLVARSPEKNQETKFYSSVTSGTPGNFSKKPKLIVTYEIDPYPFREDWAQPFATAQHTSCMNWKTNAATTAAIVRKLPNPSNDILVGADPTGAVVIYKNRPIIFTQAASGTNADYYVKQLDSKGNVIWAKGVDDVAKCWPLIDESGRLYYISRAGKLSVLDLNNAENILFSKSLSEITKNQATSVNNSATIGYDGTLYLPTEKGVFALSAYPQLKIRWKYEQKNDELNGPVSLSKDESKAFFINVNTLQNSSRFIILDNMDGALLDSSEYVLGGYKNDNNYYIPAPVVQDNSKAFVLNGFDNSNKLFVFEINEKGKIIETQSISSGQEVVNTGISQTVINANSDVFFVFNNKLARYNGSDTADVFKGSDSLDNASILVTDVSGNIYATDPYSNPKKILGFSYSSDSSVWRNTFSVDLKTDTGNTKKNIALAPDGTLYTVTTNNLIAITPTTVSVEELTLSQLNTNTVYRAGKSITVNGMSALPSTNAILYSGGTISFKTGFHVIKGAQLTCKIGY